MDCTFCGIIAGKKPAHLVARTQSVVVFLDHSPLQPGHCLVVPADHYLEMSDCPGDVLGLLVEAAKSVALAQRAALGAQGTALRPPVATTMTGFP
jgi:histidine triad (HIT) family protein